MIYTNVGTVCQPAHNTEGSIMKKYLRTIVILLAVLLLSSCAKNEKPAEFEPFYRFDLDSPTAWKEPLKNVRFLTEGAYSFTPISEDKKVWIST